MSRPKLIAFLVIGALVIGSGVVVVKTLQAAGQFTTIKPLGGEGCRAIAGVTGAEDVAIDHATGIAYVSSTDRAAESGGVPMRGEIFTFDMADPDRGFTAATAGTPADFAPHGVSLWTSPEGEKRLFVVNHRGDGLGVVEIFAVEPGGLRHLQTVSDPLFTSPNDVHATGPDSFYLTNNGTGSPYSRLVDFALRRLHSDVVHFDGTSARQVADGFGFANGINASPDGGTIYVADTFSRQLRFFSPDADSGALTETGVLILGTGLDNIDVDAEGSLWIAAHPKQFDMFTYAMGWRSQAPSQVIRAVPGADGGGVVRTVLLDLGDRLSAASVAARHGDSYLVGSFRDSGMLLCPTPPKGD